MLLLSIFIFGNLWLNVEDGFKVLNIQDNFKAGISVILLLGITRIIDAGTGVNGTIIGTSTLWRFDFFSGIVMLALRIPSSYFLIKHFGLMGSAYSELISLTIYNFIRFEFLRRKFNMQPFSIKTLYTIIAGLVAFFVPKLLLSGITGWAGILLRSAIFSGIIIASTFIFHLTPDAWQLYNKWRKKE
jgi:hypothetical protein